MGMIGALALFVNVIVAVMLFRYREGDANMRSAWICSRNDALGNIAVLGAAIEDETIAVFVLVHLDGAVPPALGRLARRQKKNARRRNRNGACAPICCAP